MQEDDIRTLLLQVRKSYRFLYQYQKRILDLVNYIGKKFGFEYEGGYPKFSNPAPNRGSGDLGNWSWDWLNLYYYEFHFKTKKIHTNQIHFSIFILNDSGYFEAYNIHKIEKTSVLEFKNPESSKSELILVVGKNIGEPWFNYLCEDEFILKSEGQKGEIDENKFIFFKHYDLANLTTEQGAINIINDFSNCCSLHEIQLDIIENHLKR